ncbi:protein SCAF11 isoform X1 [Rousettus aegyptiacus]|uniref:SR-related CTD associated factor 11 n=2 Tax=Rousettus aegyptiacus TaxID=9407 RepID=A0A7J8JMQ6_ROUAE|nr:protein SCAF11 isoform X1 [Rousettus aegyptiacus]XP_015989798.1 protein SCAF11 isoform X1 [Rousettus aegyptiacus]XP_015989799.1 protein SCAF11 isoform X1 [Rousettus aegyptiacus]KAF6497569.1 SR-related CTD associated factor 11 [Rousettus aegyptiacus]
MRKKTVYTLNVGDQEYEDMEGKENKDNTTTTDLLYNEADRCPICLNCLLEKEVGFPESCNHVFCMTCILKWAETLASCPIDRKPFQAVFKFSALEGCVKVQVRQLREIKHKKNENSFKKQLSYHENSKSCVRKKVIGEDLLRAKLYDLKMHRNSKYSEMGGKKDTTVKTTPRRSNQCASQCFRNFFSNIFSPSSHTGESSFTCRAYCTEFIDVNEISTLISQKRQELELSWFPNTLPGIGRIDFIPWNIATEVLPLISSVLPRTIFPTCTISLENFGTSCKGYALAHTQEGEEKKQTSGTSNTRGSRRKPAATTPTRRSTRTTRAETFSQSQRSPVSNKSGCDAPDNSNPSVNVSSSAESEKQTKQAPKRKSVRRGKKPPLQKKKLRSSVPPPEKSSSSDSVDEETAESDTPPVLEKEHQSDAESSNTCTVQTNVDSESANGLRSCSEQIEENEEHTENHDTEERVESSYSESCTQLPPMLVGKETEVQKVENTVTEANVLCLENETSKNISEKGDDPLENQDQISGPSESEGKVDTRIDHPPNDFLTCSASEIEVHQAIPSLSELPENAELVVNEEKVTAINEEKVVESPVVEIIDHKNYTVKTEQLVNNPKLESSEGGIIETVDRTSTENSDVHLPGHVETKDAEIIATCDTSEHESFNNIQDSENTLLKNNLDIKLGKSLEDKTESLVEYPRSTELPNTHIEQMQKHFSEDNNEMIPMECDSICSDQNESRIELSVNADAKQLNKSSMEHSFQNNMPSSDPASEKVETVSQPFEGPVDMIDKAKKPRTRRSRFHSPSTTWAPNRDTAREKKRSQSPSPKRETGKESRKSRSPSPKKESTRGRRKSRSQSPKKDITRERRRSQSRSPKRESAREGKRSESLSPKRDTSRENRRSQSRVKDSSPREKSRSRSRERESDRDGPRRDRDRERRTRRWSRSRSRSRSPSRSRTKSKSSSFGRNDRDSYSPRWKERWANDGWRCPRGNDRYRKHDPEKQNENTRKEKNDIGSDADDPNSADKHRNDCPTWVTEKINSGPDPRTRNPEKLKDSHWEENRNENSGNSWNKNFGSGWMSNRGRGNRGRGTYRGSFAYTDQNENRWQNRKPLSGNSNGSGNDSFKFVEQQPYKRKSEQEFSFDTPADRSGWTSASSWAVRKTLPADVQNYYSRRGRNSSGSQSGWMRQEEETTEQDSNLKDQTNQQGDGSQLPINMMQPQMNVMQQQMNAQHQPMNIFPYPVGVHAPLMNIQRSSYNIHPQLPVHLHTGVPLMQVAAPTSVSQGLPPPPPPPPPSQQVNYIASQPDGKQLQGIPSASHVSNNMSTPVLPAPTAAPGNMGTVQGPSSGNTSSSSHSKASNAAVKLAESKVSVTVEASADSSKTDKKLQIQEKAAQEVKLAIKPFYQNKDITKEEYKEIVRKAVDKVCHSKSGEVNSAKVANLVKAYVDKYKYSRKGSQKKTLEEPVSTEKNIG